ncbi:MAG TPA: haloacid dehalogenase type II [Pseudonocardiaceae bacterium]|jgi:2-haloacid dehalogenase|nr:haloacid dehalogenase type II [Pseudonocardiaceae bacterium]
MKVVVFDVNETLLDLRVLDGPFDDLFGRPGLRPPWFALMLQLSFVGGLTGNYVDFTTAQHAALRMLAERERVSLSDTEADRLVGLMTALPPHADVDGALARIAASPLRVVALTNSPQAVAEAQLTHAGLLSHFDRVMSADAVRSLKPSPAPYLAVADAFDVPPSELRLVAAHSWDVAGALSVGCGAAFVARPGMVLSPIGQQPDIVGADVAAVVDRILATDV